MTDNQIDYRAVLADLEAKKAAIDASIAGIKMMLGQSSSSGSLHTQSHPNGNIASNTFSKMGAVEAAEHYLRVVGELKSTAEIVSSLIAGGIVHASKDFRKTVSTILNTKAREAGSEITKVGDRWGLSSWGPGLRRAKNANIAGEPVVEIEASEEVPLS